MLDIERIRALIGLMVENDLAEISLREGEDEVSLRRPIGGTSEVIPVASAQPSAHDVGSALPPSAALSQASVSAAELDSDLIEIKSPMVGTFYSSPTPDDQPYVDVGKVVGAESVVCIVEAMKVFNEIKAEVSGTIERVLVKNEQPVEYGQPMFLVRPD